MTHSGIAIVRVMLAFFLLFGAGIAEAQPRPADRPPANKAGEETRRPAPRGGKVEVQLMVVHATDSHSRVDVRLSRLTPYLSHLRFTGYELLDTHRAQLSTRNSETFPIAGGRKVTIELLSKDDRRTRMRVQVTAKGGKLLDTTLSINRNGTVIVAGPKYKDGILVMPLTARY
jgi:hypothetical protein